MNEIGNTPNQIMIITGAGPSPDGGADSTDGPIGIPEPPVRPDRTTSGTRSTAAGSVWDAATETWVPETQPMVIDLRDAVRQAELTARPRPAASGPRLLHAGQVPPSSSNGDATS